MTSDYYFFPPPKSEYFFQQHWESEYFFRKKNIPPPPHPSFKLNGRSLRYVWNILNEENCKKTDSHDLDLDNFTYNRKDRMKKKMGETGLYIFMP